MNSNSETKMENSDAVAADVHNSSTKSWPTNMKELVDPKGPFIPLWNVIFIVSCVCSVFLDPLFLYIPIINDNIKCLSLDNNLKISALVLRSATDLCYLLNIFFQVYSYSTNSPALRRRISFLPNIANTMWHSYILIDIIAVLPIPQIIVLIFYFNMRGSRSVGTKKPMNFFILVQYVPRVCRIYLSCKEYSKKYSREEIPIWIKGVLNFFLYILASHVMGAFWYFFAVQRITTCWQYACRLENGCVPNNLYCHDHHALRNIKFLDELCSVDPPNEKLFNFGIFLDILQLGILGSTDYFKKFSNCFSWGLRNLSPSSSSTTSPQPHLISPQLDPSRRSRRWLSPEETKIAATHRSSASDGGAQCGSHIRWTTSNRPGAVSKRRSTRRGRSRRGRRWWLNRRPRKEREREHRSNHSSIRSHRNSVRHAGTADGLARRKQKQQQPACGGRRRIAEEPSRSGDQRGERAQSDRALLKKI